jgi:hypothetical protein
MSQQFPESLASKDARLETYLGCLTNIEKLQKEEYITAPYRQAGWTGAISALIAIAATWLLGLDKLQAVIVFGSLAITIGMAIVMIAICHYADIIQLRLHAISLAAATFDRTSN